jgi:hypothetical protein
VICRSTGLDYSSPRGTGSACALKVDLILSAELAQA